MATTYRVPVENTFAWQQPVKDILADAPGGEAKGDRYLVAATPTPAGAFDGHANEVAYVTSTGPTVWAFDAPVEGWQLYDQDSNATYIYGGASWAATGDHAQNTDTGTSGTTFEVALGSGNNTIKLESNADGTDATLTITTAALDGDYTATFPAATGTVALTSQLHTQNTDTGTTGSTFTVDSDATTGKLKLEATPNAGEDHTMTITNAVMTGDVTLTLPATTGTVALTSDIPAVTGLTGTTSNTWTVDSDSSTGKITIDVNLNAGEDHTLTLTNEAMTADVTATFPAATGTVFVGAYDSDYKCLLCNV